MSEIITNAMIIDEKDTVAVAIEPVKAGQAAAWLDKTGGLHEVTAVTDIPIYHKFAIRDMQKGEPVVKYGGTYRAGCQGYPGRRACTYTQC